MLKINLYDVCLSAVHVVRFFDYALRASLRMTDTSIV